VNETESEEAQRTQLGRRNKLMKTRRTLLRRESLFNESSAIDMESEEAWRTQFGQEKQANGIEASENRPTILSRERTKL